jgi:NADH dehydrogenase
MNGERSIKLDIAIVGGGFAGVYCAKAVTRGLGRRNALKVGLIAEENYMVFQPMLPEVASGSISPRHVVNPLRLLCRRAEVLRGTIEQIDWPGKSLVLNAGMFTGNLTIHYDHLVLALGAVVDLSRIPGMPEHAFLMKSVGDAMFLRTTLIGRIEEASLEPDPEIKRRLLTFVVVGGGYSGVETAGHILDLYQSIRRYYPSIAGTDVQVHLIHSRDHLLPTLSRRLGEYSARKLTERGLKLVLNQPVKAVTANRVHLQDGTSIETNTVISTVGNAPHPIVTKLCEQCGFERDHGLVVTDASGRVKGQTHLWAAGDCAAVPFVAGGYCPGTAQFALRQGVLIGDNLARLTRQQGLRIFNFKGLGEMASIGHHTAVADILGLNFSGFFAWWLWRTIYFMKLPRFDRKVRVLLDWTLDLFFPRDINHLSPRFSRLLKEIHLEPGDVLYHKGEPAFSLYIVKEGCVEIRDEDETIQQIQTGEYFGERALLGDGIRHDDAVAAQSSRLVSIPAGVFRQIVQGAGSLGRFFQKSASKYQSREVLEALDRKIPTDLASKSVAEVMEKKLFTFSLNMTVREALELTKRYPRSSYPVIDGAERLLGTVLREDFYEFIKRPETTPDTRIQEMSLSTLPTIGADLSVRDTMKFLLRSGSNKLLVTDGEERLRGIVTVMDLVSAETKNHADE